MKVGYSADVIEDSGLKQLLYSMQIGKPYKGKNYGNNEVELFFVINCLDFDAKNRIRFSNTDKVLYWDILLNYQEIKAATLQQKKIMLATSIINSFAVLDKYRKLKLDKTAIQNDAEKYFRDLRWI